MEIPKDNEEAKENYGNMCCGQSCLAIIENISIGEVMGNWKKVIGRFKGYSPYKDVRKYLENKGYNVKLCNFNKSPIEFEEDTFYLYRVQWIGNGEKQGKPYYGWGSWYEASNHTHFILIYNGKVFCNSDGIFPYLKLVDYLGDIRKGERGLLTSFLKIKKEVRNR